MSNTHIAKKYAGQICQQGPNVRNEAPKKEQK